MSDKHNAEHLIKCAINHSNCSIVDSFREFHQSGEISNNAELILDAAEFFQKLSREFSEENKQLAEDNAKLRDALGELIKASTENEEQLNDLLACGNYGESKALCDARELLESMK